MRFAALTTSYVLPALVMLAAPPVAAQKEAADYPSRVVTLVNPFAPGASTDIVARIVAQKLSELWGRQMVVENRPGADGSIATEIVAKSPADGYTLVMVSNAHTITPFQRKLAYDPVKDFAP